MSYFTDEDVKKSAVRAFGCWEGIVVTEDEDGRRPHYFSEWGVWEQEQLLDGLLELCSDDGLAEINAECLHDLRVNVFKYTSAEEFRIKQIEYLKMNIDEHIEHLFTRATTEH